MNDDFGVGIDDSLRGAPNEEAQEVDRLAPPSELRFFPECHEFEMLLKAQEGVVGEGLEKLGVLAEVLKRRHDLVFGELRLDSKFHFIN